MPTSCSDGRARWNQLEEVAGDLWRDERLGVMAPAEAAVEWLRPMNAGRV